MRSNRDLDSKTPRHNRQGLIQREPPHPFRPLLPSTSVKTITDRRGAAGGEGPSVGTVPAHYPHLPNRGQHVASSISNTRQLHAMLAPKKFLEREPKECQGNVWINFCWGLLNRLLYQLVDCFLLPEERQKPAVAKWFFCECGKCVPMCVFNQNVMNMKLLHTKSLTFGEIFSHYERSL